MLSYIEKAIQDPFYQSTYKYFGKQGLAPSGFLYDKNDNQKSLCEIFFKIIKMSNISIDKILNNLNSISEADRLTVIKNKKIYILLSTGAFNPIHEGHLKMMDLAWAKANEKNFFVAGGYFSPAHDEYVFEKDNRFKINSSSRITQINKIVQTHPLLVADDWETTYYNYSINFTNVITYMKTALTNLLEHKLISLFKEKITVEIIYVFGSDNVKFINTFVENGYAICVPRNPEDILNIESKFKEIYHFNFNEPKKRIFISQAGINLSSTQIRNKLFNSQA